MTDDELVKAFLNKHAVTKVKQGSAVGLPYRKGFARPRKLDKAAHLKCRECSRMARFDSDFDAISAGWARDGRSWKCAGCEGIAQRPSPTFRSRKRRA